MRKECHRRENISCLQTYWSYIHTQKVLPSFSKILSSVTPPSGGRICCMLSRQQPLHGKLYHQAMSYLRKGHSVISAQVNPLFFTPVLTSQTITSSISSCCWEGSLGRLSALFLAVLTYLRNAKHINQSLTYFTCTEL